MKVNPTTLTLKITISVMSGARIRRMIRKIATDAWAGSAILARSLTLGGAVRPNIWCQNTSSGLLTPDPG
jgi:hypothetical protein